MTHPTLIKANIALYKGERAEAQRLLREYQTQPPGVGAQRAAPLQDKAFIHDDDAALILWLDANVQTDHDERLRRLYDLIAAVDVDNPYGRIARDYLYEEEQYARQLKPMRNTPGVHLFGVAWWKAAAFILFGAVGIFIAITALNLTGSDPLPESAAVNTPVIPTVTAAPDRSRALVADSFTARYADGILQVTTLENGSQRVVNSSGDAVSPVAGARFYALRIVFECRRGICDAPPEAALTVQMDNGDIIEVRDDLMIAGGETLEPIALGRTTSGWLVFQVPLVNRVEALRILPDDSQTPEILTIELPETQE